MKRTHLLLFAAALLCLAGCQSKKFTLSGDLESARFDARTDSLLLQSDAFPTLISIQVKDGHFSYRGKVQEPVAASLKGVGGKISTKPVVLEKGNITFQDGLPCGTPLNDAYSDLIRSLMQIVKDHPRDPEAIQAAATETLRTYLSVHGADPSAVPALMAARRFTTQEALAELIGMASPQVQNDGNIRSLKRHLKK